MVIAKTMRDIRGYLKPEEVGMLLAAASNVRDYLIIRMLWRTGMRITELITLKKDNILWDENTLIIIHQKQRKKDGKEIIRERRIPIDHETLVMLAEYLNKVGDNDERVFPLSREHVYRTLRKIGEKVGLEKVGGHYIHPHILRHSFAIHFAKSVPGTLDNMRKLQMILGHQNINTTAGYWAYSVREIDDVYQKLWKEEDIEE